MILLLFLFLLFLFFALIPSAVAERKGRSQLGFFLLSLVATPLISLIVVLIVEPARHNPVPTASTLGVADEIMKLGSLRDAGLITAEEFERQRSAVLLAAPPAGPVKAPPGYQCGRCSKPLSPAWKGKCEHCKASYAEFKPVLRLA